MKIWIRTQDRTELILCDDFRMNFYTNSRCDIVAYDNTILGIYQSEARALEVFDMIEQHMIKYNSIPFTMPKE